MLKGVSPSMNQVPEVVIRKGKVQKPREPGIKNTRVDAMAEYVVSGVRKMRAGEALQNPNPNA
jgi:hypothetical protein